MVYVNNGGKKANQMEFRVYTLLPSFNFMERKKFNEKGRRIEQSATIYFHQSILSAPVPFAFADSVMIANARNEIEKKYIDLCIHLHYTEYYKIFIKNDKK